ncbi:hypothetical protein [Pseudomonas huanghezhanensis]|uniref:hypothetical protein n=1 Tax=Pseudomonas huanghezhanensis TaxID=3002903 RepID=UPI002285EB29|nr:hypothetical protein [Pseudomonas sp. BSw22131]
MSTPIPKSKRPLPKSKRLGLRSKPAGKLATARLAFVGKDHGRPSSWDVPMSGGFHGGCDVGKSVFRLFLKYVRDEQSNPCRLSSVLLESMLRGLASKQPETPEEVDSVDGQRAGFLSEMGKWIEAAAAELGSSLDRVSEQELVDETNRHLARTDAALMAVIKAMEAP